MTRTAWGTPAAVQVALALITGAVVYALLGLAIRRSAPTFVTVRILPAVVQRGSVAVDAEELRAQFTRPASLWRQVT